MTPDDPRHGTRAGYYAHRKADQTACLDCKRGAAQAERGYELARIQGRQGRVPAIGTQRRLRALQALGWTLTELATLMNSERTRVEKWANDEKTYVYATTAARVAEIYDRLCMTIPSGGWAERNRNHARRMGYMPPLAWDDIDTDPEPPAADHDDDIDPVVVMRLLEGQRIESTKAEKVAALERWVADGGTERELCAWHGWKAGRYSTGLRAIRGGAA